MPADPRTVLICNPGADLYGSDRMVVESVRALVEGDFTVFVTVPGPGPLIDLLTGAGATVLEQPTPIIRRSLLSPGGLLQLARETLSAWGPSWQLLKYTNAGTVLVNTITPPLWPLLGKLARRRVVCHVHEAESTVSPLLRRALYLPLSFADRIVINSQFTRHVLGESASWLTDRARVVYNTVSGPSQVVLARADLTAPIRLLYVGRLSQRKGPQVAVEAVRQLRERGRDVQLDLLGAVFPGNEAYEEGLREQVAEAGLADAVRFLGFRPAIWDTVAEADIVVIPALVDESFGNTAVEASLAGRPLIVSEIAGLKEASEAATSRIFVPPADATAIADAVEAIADDWTSYAEKASTDAVLLADRFSFRQYADGLIDAMGLDTGV
ncbi:MAG: glycosyltransferase [Propionicimonas sp.]|nr:glycosyltransferase [Propionicimonas sp.]